MADVFLGSVYAELDLRTNKFNTSVRSAVNSGTILKSTLLGTFGGNVLYNGINRLGEAVTGFAAETVTSAGDFQQGMNILQAVTGATSKQMDVLSDKAIALGNDLTLPNVSAKDAADAMVELGKAGLGVNDILGASKGVLEAATAGNIDFSKAAQLVANALLAFKLPGTQAVHVADLLAGAANASSLEVEDVGLALQQAGAQAKLAGVPLEDTVTAIAEMANQGIKAQVAGTSLSYMLRQLIAPTAAAKKTMEQLGINVFDSKGNFIGLRDASQVLQDKLKGLSQQQKAQALQTIFGAEAMKAASVLVDGGAKAFDNLKKKVDSAGAAQRLSEARTKGFKGALNALQSQVETLQLNIGNKLLPALTDFVKYISAHFDGAINTIKNDLKALYETFKPVFKALGDGIKTAFDWIRTHGKEVTAIFAGIGVAIGALATLKTLQMLNGIVNILVGFSASPVALGVLAIGGAFALLVEQSGGLEPALKKVQKAMAWFADHRAAVEGAIAAIATVFLGFKLKKVYDNLGGLIKQFNLFTKGTIPAVIKSMAEVKGVTLANELNLISTPVELLRGKFVLLIAKMKEFAALKLAGTVSRFSGLFSTLGDVISTKAIGPLGKFGEVLGGTKIGGAIARFGGGIGRLAAGIGGPLMESLGLAGAAFPPLGIALAAIALIVAAVVAHFGGFKQTLDALKPVLNNVGHFISTTLWPALKSLGSLIASIVLPFLKALGDVIVAVFGAAIEILKPVVALFKGIFDALEPLFPVLKVVAAAFILFFTPIGPIIIALKVLTPILKLVAWLIEQIGKVINFILSPLKALGKAFSWLGGLFGGGKKNADDFNDSLSKTPAAANKMTDSLKGIDMGGIGDDMGEKFSTAMSSHFGGIGQALDSSLTDSTNSIAEDFATSLQTELVKKGVDHVVATTIAANTQDMAAAATKTATEYIQKFNASFVSQSQRLGIKPTLSNELEEALQSTKADAGLIGQAAADNIQLKLELRLRQAGFSDVVAKQIAAQSPAVMLASGKLGSDFASNFAAELNKQLVANGVPQATANAITSDPKFLDSVTTQFGKTAGDLLTGAYGDSVAPAGDMFNSILLNSLPAASKDGNTLGVAAGGGVIQGMSSMLQGGGITIQNATGVALQGVSGALGTATLQGGAVGSAVLNSLNGTISVGQPTTTSTLQGVISGATNSSLGIAVQGGNSLGNALTLNVAGGAKNDNGTTPALQGTLNNAVDNTLHVSSGGGDQLGNALTLGVANGAGNDNGATISLQGSINNAVNNSKGNASRGGSSLGSDTTKSLGHGMGDNESWLQRVLKGIVSSFIGVVPTDILFGSGKGIMQGLLSGLQSAYGHVQNFVSGVAGWIKDHKGPISKDKLLLVDAGNAIMQGFQSGLEAGFKDTQKYVKGIGPQLSNLISAQSPSSALSGLSGFSSGDVTNQNITSPLNIYGDVNIGSQGDADYLFNRLTRRQDLTTKGIVGA